MQNFANLPQLVHLLSWGPVLVLSMMRPLGMMLLLPLFKGTTTNSKLVRNSLIVMIAIPIVPMVKSLPLNLTHFSTLVFMLLCAQDFLIGLLIGFCAAVSFWAIDMVGFIIDSMRGATMSTIINPLSNLDTSVFGVFFAQLITTLFLLTGGFGVLLRALYMSYHSMPTGTSFSLNTKLLYFLIDQWNLMLGLALSFVFPAIILMFMTDMALGLLNRSFEQMNVFFLSMPIKSALVVFLLVITLHNFIPQYSIYIREMEQHIGMIFSLLKG